MVTRDGNDELLQRPYGHQTNGERVNDLFGGVVFFFLAESPK